VNFGHNRKGCLDEIEVHIPQAHEFSSDIEQVCFFNATILGIFFYSIVTQMLADMLSSTEMLYIKHFRTWLSKQHQSNCVADSIIPQTNRINSVQPHVTPIKSRDTPIYSH
jgi:hypothetical protein